MKIKDFRFRESEIAISFIAKQESGIINKIMSKQIKKKEPINKSEPENVKPVFGFVFKKKNYLWMIIGLAVIALGFILMIGGGSDDPNVFNPEIFSWRRIRLAPALVIIGFGIQVYAILLDPDK